MRLKSITSNADFISIEHEILKFWQENECFKKLQKKNEGGPPFRFVDGPITANNPMGVHHAWGRILKDIFLRYKALRGYRSHYQNGFDCQGLWVEVEVEKELGFHGKPDIVKFGLDNFSNACRARVEKFSKIQTQQSIRLGQWMDWEHSYYTHNDSNILGIWHFLKSCYKNGWIYRSQLAMPWCPRCGTSLSEHEMAGSYKEMEHLAVFIKLFLKERNAHILVWTTTPWTLAANVALAVNPNLKYSEVKIEEEDLPLILCSDVLDVLGDRKYRIIRQFLGKELEGALYEPILSGLEVQKQIERRIVSWDAVDPSEGTGVVHIAPGCGREDHELGTRLGLDVLSPVDDEGIYVSGYGWLEGKTALSSAEEIIGHLKRKNNLFHQYMHRHSYPICWRCKSELIFRLVNEWFIDCKDIRPAMIKASAEVQWQPRFMGKRMEDWLQNMGDWCISRKRFWGLPLPFYECPACGKLTVVGSLDELEKLSDDDVTSLPELHRPWIDKIEINCPECGNKVSRIQEVGDCWLDAGIVPYSTRGYLKDRSAWKEWYPVEWVCEMREQIRLWFYSMLFMGVTLDNRSPYQRVLTYERVVAEDGRPFSKTSFMIKLDDVAEKMGVDTLRYYFAGKNPANDIRFGYDLGYEARRRLLSFWNIYVFFITYARLDKPNFDKIKELPGKLNSSDQWLLARLYHFMTDVSSAMEDYDTPTVIREFDSFTEDVSNFYVRTNRRRFWIGRLSEDRLIGYWCLYQVIKTTVLIMSPVIPFLTEAIWQDGVRTLDDKAALSVHLADWPTLKESWQDDRILRQVKNVRKVLNLALRIRKRSNLRIRQPLATLYLVGPKHIIESSKLMAATIQNEINVKQVEYLDSEESLQSEYVILDFRMAGQALRQNLSRVKLLLEELSFDQMDYVVGRVKEKKKIDLPGWKGKLSCSLFLLKTRPRPDIILERKESIVVALDVRITDSLEREGWIREILRHCQVLRKDTELRVEDRINLAISTSSNQIREAIEKSSSLIKDETLAVDIVERLDDSSQVREISLSAGTVQISLEKA